MTQTMIERVNQYLADGQTIVPDWYKYITDKAIPLDDRWNTFVAAPTEWKREEHTLSIPLPHAERVFNSPYDDFHLEYGERKDIDSLIDDIREKVEDGEVEFTEADIDICREFILKNKLGSWLYDN